MTTPPGSSILHHVNHTEGDDMTPTIAQRAEAARLLSLMTTPQLAVGLGTIEQPCTYAAIMLALTGELSDDPHPCISPVIRQWVICVQDAAPETVRDSPAWREAAVRIIGTAADSDVESARTALIIDWMFERLADEALLHVLPESARSAWDIMLRDRTDDVAWAAAFTVTAFPIETAFPYTNALAQDAAQAAAQAAARAVTLRAAPATDSASYAVDVASNAADAAAYAAEVAFCGDLIKTFKHSSGARSASNSYWKQANLPATLNALCDIGASS